MEHHEWQMCPACHGRYLDTMAPLPGYSAPKDDSSLIMCILDLFSTVEGTGDTISILIIQSTSQCLTIPTAQNKSYVCLFVKKGKTILSHFQATAWAY